MNDPVLSAVGDLLGDIQADMGEEPVLVNRAVIVCETLDSDGERRLRMIYDGNLKTWEVRGLVGEVMSDLNAYDVVWAMEGESDD